MSSKALNFFLKLLDIRKSRSALVANRARAELERVKTFESQLIDYQREYQRAWVESAQRGGTVDELYARASFVSRLGDTVEAQRPEVEAASERFDRASKRVIADSMRSSTLRNYLNTRRSARKRAREHREEREANERGGIPPRR